MIIERLDNSINNNNKKKESFYLNPCSVPGDGLKALIPKWTLVEENETEKLSDMACPMSQSQESKLGFELGSGRLPPLL